MKRNGRNFGAGILLAAGIVCVAFGLLRLIPVRDVLEYVIPMPQGTEAGEHTRELYAAVDQVRDGMSDAASALSMAGVTEKLSLLVGDESVSTMVYAVGEQWFDVYPAQIEQGRTLMESELLSGAKLAVIDESLAFKLYGEMLPDNATLELAGEEYRVVGTARFAHSVGARSDHCVWVPLLSLMRQEESAAVLGSLSPDVLMLSALPVKDSGARGLFESAACTQWQDGGSMYSLGKEAMRGTIILRAAIFLLGMGALFRLIPKMNGVTQRRMRSYRALLKERYFPGTVPALLRSIAVCILGYGALLMLAYGLLHFTFEPLYTFTEWVPDNITSWTSLKKVFWNLIDEHAKLISCGSVAMREIEFYSGCVRWGAFTTLIGIVLFLWRGKRES